MALRDFSQFYGCAEFFLVFFSPTDSQFFCRMAMRDSQFFSLPPIFFVFFLSHRISVLLSHGCAWFFLSFMLKSLPAVLGYCLKVICFFVLITWYWLVVIQPQATQLCRRHAQRCYRHHDFRITPNVVAMEAQRSLAARPVPYVRGRDPFGMLLSWNWLFGMLSSC
jgi:hypothetical protein